MVSCYNICWQRKCLGEGDDAVLEQKDYLQGLNGYWECNCLVLWVKWNVIQIIQSIWGIPRYSWYQKTSTRQIFGEAKRNKIYLPIPILSKKPREKVSSATEQNKVCNFKPLPEFLFRKYIRKQKNKSLRIQDYPEISWGWDWIP